MPLSLLWEAPSPKNRMPTISLKPLGIPAFSKICRHISLIPPSPLMGEGRGGGGDIQELS
jgi:hypothetical protein